MVLDHRDRELEHVAQLEQRVAELMGLLRTHAGRRLVEQQHVRVGGEHRGDLDALERAVGEPGDLGVEQVGEPEHLGDGVGALDAGARSLTTERRLPSIPASVG